MLRVYVCNRLLHEAMEMSMPGIFVSLSVSHENATSVIDGPTRMVRLIILQVRKWFVVLRLEIFGKLLHAKFQSKTVLYCRNWSNLIT